MVSNGGRCLSACYVVANGVDLGTVPPVANSGGRCPVDATGLTMTRPDGTTTAAPAGGVVEGKIKIPNLGPNRYTLSVTPPDGSGWVQTTTLEGNHDWDAWVMEGATGLDTEFVIAGEPFPAIIFGFIPVPGTPSAVGSALPPSLGGTGTIKGVVEAVKIYVPTTGGVAGLPGEIWGGLQGAKIDKPIANPWVTLTNLGNGDTIVWVGQGDANGRFTIPNVPAGTYTLTWWDEPQNTILDLVNVTVGSGETVDMGILPLSGWWTFFDGYVFNDTNRNGVKDPGEPGLAGYTLTMRKRENSLMDRGTTSTTTDANGYYKFEAGYPMTQWLVMEAYDDLHYTTDITYQADNQPAPTTVLGAGVDVSVHPIIGLGGRMDWGKHVYDPTGANGIDPRNGGIVGTVSYDTTRNETDPRYAAVEAWQPSIPDLPMYLYAPATCGSTAFGCDPTNRFALAQDGSYAKGKLLNTYLTETWQRPTGCIARGVDGNPMVHGVDEQVLPLDDVNGGCIEAPLMGVQFAPYATGQGTPEANFGATVDGNCGFGDGCFNSVLDATDVSAPQCVCGNLYRYVGNDPGVPGRLNPNYNPTFRTIAAEFEILPGLIAPADLAPTQVGVTVQLPGGQTTAPVQCKLDDATPQLFAVSRPYADFRASAAAVPITLFGKGFGASKGSGQVSLGGVNLATTTWSDTQIVATVPSSALAGPRQLMVASGNGQTTVNGLSFHVVKVGHTPTIRAVGPGKAFAPAETLPAAADHAIQRSIQRAIDASRPGDLVVVYPNTPTTNSRQNPRGAYYENLIINKPIKLQGVGPGSPDGTVRGSIIDGGAFAGDSPVATDWQAKILTLTWSGNQTVYDGAVISLFLPSSGANAFPTLYNALTAASVDGFDLRGGDQQGFPGNINAIGGTRTGQPAGLVTQGGAIYANGYARNLQITKNVKSRGCVLIGRAAQQTASIRPAARAVRVGGAAWCSAGQRGQGSVVKGAPGQRRASSPLMADRIPARSKPEPRPVPTLREQLDRRLGLWRSWWIYRGIPWRAAQLRRFYRRFVPAGGLAFDVGAHEGNRVAAFRRLGARVVAVEPQADFVRRLQRRFADDPQVSILPLALGRAPGEAQLLASARTPTVTTLSTEFTALAGSVESFRKVRWTPGPVVAVDTLDALIARHGRPDFAKIDVEGYELEVLMGLSQPLPALSFEFVPALREVALGCIDRLEALAAAERSAGADLSGAGPYAYAVSLSEQLRLQTPQGLSAVALRAWLQALPADAPSGDVHAWRVPAG